MHFPPPSEPPIRILDINLEKVDAWDAFFLKIRIYCVQPNLGQFVFSRQDCFQNLPLGESNGPDPSVLSACLRNLATPECSLVGMNPMHSFCFQLQHPEVFETAQMNGYEQSERLFENVAWFDRDGLPRRKWPQAIRLPCASNLFQSQETNGERRSGEFDAIIFWSYSLLNR